MITFWIAAALLSALVAAPILLGAQRGAKAAPDGEDPTLALHRRQLSEIDDLAARGLLSEGELASARAEAGRRLLASADVAAPASPEASSLARNLAIGGAVAAPLLGLLVYLAIGSPAAPDQPFARRLAAWASLSRTDPRQLRPDEMIAVLEAISRERPNDAEAPRYLASLRLAQGDAAGAVDALRRAVALTPDEPALWSQLGETMVVQAEGEVTDDAVLAFREAQKRSPEMPAPRYFLARRQIADGRTAEGLAAWRALAAQLAEGPNRAMLQGEIDAVAATGRLPASDAPAQAEQPQVGPAQIAAMVDSLAARLKQQPDDPEGWMRLVRAYTVMGETAKRDAALAEARARYKNDPDVLSGLNNAAEAPR